MKLAELTGIRQMAIVDAPEPAIAGDHDVLLRIDTVGVCGSDIHYYRTGRIGSQVVEYPFPVGHECSAIVVEVGPAVTRVKPGDRVAVDPAVPCNECDQCLAGRKHTCRKLVFMGCPGQIPGCLGDFYVMPEGSLFPIPETMSMEVAALVEPLTIGYYAVKLSGLWAGARIGILGAGPIGLSVMVAARYKGAGAIYVTEPLEYRRELAGANGATLAVHPEEDGIAPIVEAEPGLLDIVFECSGEQAAVDQGQELLKPGGKLMLIGIPEVDTVTLRADVMRRRELVIQNVRRQNECVEETLEMLADPGVDVGFMVTHRFDFPQTKTAFDLVDGYHDGVVKAMIRV